jgi:hypothetical protein
LIDHNHHFCNSKQKNKFTVLVGISETEASVSSARPARALRISRMIPITVDLVKPYIKTNITDSKIVIPHESGDTGKNINYELQTTDDSTKVKYSFKSFDGRAGAVSVHVQDNLEGHSELMKMATLKVDFEIPELTFESFEADFNNKYKIEIDQSTKKITINMVKAQTS